MNIFNTKRVYDTIYEASPRPDKSKSLKSWQKKCQIFHDAVCKMATEHEDEVQKAAEKYSQDYISTQEKEYKSIANAVIGKRKEELRNDLQQLLDGKKSRFREVALSAPSDEQIRLLQALALRDDLTEAEVAGIAAQLGGNHQALRSLRSIARKSGVDMIAPPACDEIEEKLNRAQEFCEEMLNFIENKTENLSYNERCFFEYTGVGLPHILFHELDESLYAAVQKPERKMVETVKTEVVQEDTNKKEGTNHPSPYSPDAQLEKIHKLQQDLAAIKKERESRAKQNSGADSE